MCDDWPPKKIIFLIYWMEDGASLIFFFWHTSWDAECGWNSEVERSNNVVDIFDVVVNDICMVVEAAPKQVECGCPGMIT